MRIIIIATFAVTMLAGCDMLDRGGNAAGNATDSPIAGTGAPPADNPVAPRRPDVGDRYALNAPPFVAGLWATEGRMIAIEQVGGSPRVAAQVAQAQAKIDIGQTSVGEERTCLSSSEARDGAKRLFVNGSAAHYEDVKMDRGRLQATLVTDPATPAIPDRLTISGDMTPASYDFDVVLLVRDATGMRMTTRARMTGRRLGDCMP